VFRHPLLFEEVFSVAKQKYTVIFPIKHDGKNYKKGDTVQMDSEIANPLVMRGVLAASKAEPVEVNSGMPDPVVGQPRPPEGAATQLTADPGIPTQGA
jgi:hypothetical protein